MPTVSKTQSPVKKASTRKKKETVVEREILYPEIKVKIYKGEKAMTIKDIQEMLGWQEETDKEKFGSDYLLIDVEGKKIRCTNNMTNRPLYMSVCSTYKQEHLNRRWRFNGEPIIIGQTGQILDGQHTLISAVLAEQERVGEKQAQRWETIHGDKPITLEKLVVFGIPEDDETINTMNTGKPRTIADIIYRSEFFVKLANDDRRTASRMVDHAIRMLWARTGASSDPFAPRRTPSEAIDFINRHPKLLKAVKHIMDENTEGAIRKYLSPGYASAMLYLMASCTTDGDEYRNAEHPSEKQMDFENWEIACEFWVLLGSGSEAMNKVRDSINSLSTGGSGGGTVAERVAILCKAWNLFKDKDRIEADDVTLKLGRDYRKDENGRWHLSKPIPDVGGVDLGEPSSDDDEDSEGAKADIESNGEPYTPTPEEIEDRARAIKEESLKETTDEDRKAKRDKLLAARAKKQRDDIPY